MSGGTTFIFRTLTMNNFTEKERRVSFWAGRARDVASHATD